MIHTGKLLACELYDSMGREHTNVKRVWEARHSRHSGRCVVMNAHWWDPGPRQCGNYKADGAVLSRQYAEPFRGFGWDGGEPRWTQYMDSVKNFVSTVIALVDGRRQELPDIPAVTGRAARTWLGRSADGDWTAEVTATAYTCAELVERLEKLGITDAMIFDGGGSSQAYDGETYIKGDGRTIYSYLLCWFEDKEDDKAVDYRKGIDVSKHQGTIDWEKVKADGVEFAMLRAGYGQNKIDEQFERNASECTRLGIPFGVYWFSYAYTEAMAKREAEYCLAAAKPYKLSYPIAFDFEYDSVDYAEEKGIKVTKELASKFARAFLDAIEGAGYYAMLYANPNYLSQYFDADIPSRYDIWLAKWPTNPDISDNPGPGGMWQYTSSGAVDGIEGRVDMNVAYKDYPSLIGYMPTPIEPTPEPEEPPMTYEEEKADATEWAKIKGISDGTRPYDPVQRVELWVMLWRLMGGEK